ncbi:MAG: hypothetical protein DBX49_05670 [Clostridia bacterium]|nr:DUF421 domain-containing protein [Oscillospiraceae bacterium]PWM14985.1 MAG: hypothetical protein DBX49_05670 [Clostridia bacterium]
MAIVIIRTLIIYFALLLTMRLLGKRQLGEMELSEFVLAALIADLASHPLQDIGIPMINGLVPILVLFCCEVIIAGITMKHIRLRSVFFGKPSLLVVRGRIDQREMRKNRFTVDELMEELRNQSCMDISRIEYAILETDGQLNVILFPAERPVTSAQLGLEAGSGGYPFIVISDGKVLEANLRHAGRDLNWLQKQLTARGFEDAKGVFLMTVNDSGQIYFAPKEAAP